MRILVIDPGATSTKVGIYEDGNPVFSGSIDHDRRSLNRFSGAVDQEEMRFRAIESLLTREGHLPGEFAAVAGRGGLIKPVKGGTYEVNGAMLEDLRKGEGGEHASNLGGILAERFASLLGSRAFIVDPVVVDELEPLARLSGLKGIERQSIFHALNQKAVARRIASDLKKRYQEINLIVAHIGSGISVGAHRKGRVIDVNNALDGDGPYSQERTGGLPLRGVLELIGRRNTSVEELSLTVRKSGGLYSYLGEADLRKIEKCIDRGDREARRAFEGMAYQVSKEIGALAAVLMGRVDATVLTGGGAYSRRLVSLIRERVDFIAPVFVIPGELELEALAEGVKRVLAGEESVQIYG